MQSCFLKIVTHVNGEKNTVYKRGSIQRKGSAVRFFYEKNGANVSLEISGKSVNVVRDGDYSLRLRLKEGELTVSELGIGGNVGQIKTKTHKITCDIRVEKCTIALCYSLIFEKEIQEMQLEIVAQVNSNSEEK